MLIRRYLKYLFLYIKFEFWIRYVFLNYKIYFVPEETSFIELNELNTYKVEQNEQNSTIFGRNFSYVDTLIDDEFFEKPKISNRKYRYLKLKNSMQVFLVSDKHARISTGSLLIRAGSMSEPENLPGLARYLQYLILFGSVKNQCSKDFKTFVVNNGGSYSLKTERGKTRYDFLVSSNVIETSLKLFANLFTNLSMFDNNENIILAILENEFNNLLNSDTFRLSDVIREISDPNHPSHHFGYGNINTLKIIPEQQKIDIKEKLVDFFQQNYNANKMTLTVLSDKSLDELTFLVAKFFIKIKNEDSNKVFNFEISNTRTKHPLYKSTSKVLVFYSIQDIPLLKIVFPLKTYLLPYMLSKPKFFFSSYISSKRNGSLYYYLIKHDLVIDIKLIIKNFSTGFTNFIIDIKLQKLGKKNILRILKGIFSVFEKMREDKLPLDLFELSKNLKRENFNYTENDFLKECIQIQNSFYLFNCPPEKVLSITSTYSDYNMELHHKILDDLRPENMLIIVPISDLKNNLCKDNPNIRFNKKTFSDLCFDNLQIINEKVDTKYCSSCIYIMNNTRNFGYNLLLNETLCEEDFIISNYTGTRYILKDIHPCVISYLSTIDSTTALNEFEIFDPNVKLLKLRTLFSSLKDVLRYDIPVRLSQAIMLSGLEDDIRFLSGDLFTDYQRFFYMPTNNVNTPKVQVLIIFKLPLENIFDKIVIPSSTKKLELIFSIITFILTRSFDDISYYLKKTSVEVSFTKISPLKNPSTTFGLSIEVKAYYLNLSHIISVIATRLKNFPKYINNSYFKMAKEIYIRTHKSMQYNYQFSYQFYAIRKKLTFNQDVSDQALLRELQEITIEDLINVNNILILNGQIDGFIFGNITPGKSRELILKFVINLGRSYTFNKKPPPERLKLLHLIVSFLYLILNKLSVYILAIINYITNNINFYYKLPEKIKSVPTHNNTLNSIINFQAIDLLSLNKGNSYYYSEPSYCKKKTNNAILLNVYIGYNTRETEILVDVILAAISNNYIDELKIKKKLGHILSIKKSIIFDHLVTIQFYVISSHETIQTLIMSITRFCEKWFDPDSLMVTKQIFENAKDSVLNSLNNDLIDHKNLINSFTEEIFTKRYDFKRKSAQVEFLNKLNYKAFKNWFIKFWNDSNKLLLAIYSPLQNEKDLDELLKYTPPGYIKINSTSYFFEQENTKSFNPKITYKLD